MATEERLRQVTGACGVRLAVAETGDPAAPTVVCLHGYPDNRTVWDGVVTELANRYHVVTYDMRGAGDSGTPPDRRSYRLDRLVEDLAAVIDAASPAAPVHLLGHDWGSIAGWHAVAGGRLAGRITSYTSISGPCLDYAARWMRRNLTANPRQVLSQLAHSSYIGFFALPLLPELAWRSGLMTWLLRREPHAAAPRLPDGLHGLQLYRANMFARYSRPVPRRTSIPAQVLAPAGDRYVTLPLQAGSVAHLPQVRVHEISGGHWVVRASPALVARHATELIDQAEQAPRG